MAGAEWVALAALAFVGSHFLLSHPLRQPLVAAFGESAFLVICSLVAGITLAGVAWSYQAAPTTALLWPVGNTLWAIVTVVMLLASVLLMGSVIRNRLCRPAERRLPFPTERAASSASRVTR